METQQLQYKLSAFEGPLDLLLTLISKNKIDIYDISISELLDQYMEQINMMQENQMDIASEFLTMASRLVYIKSVMLLPKYEEEAEELKKELSGQLLEYAVCREMAAKLGDIYDFDSFYRDASPVEFDLTYNRIHPSEDIAKAYVSAVGRGKRKLPPSKDAFSGIVATFLATLELVKGKRIRIEGSGENAVVHMIEDKNAMPLPQVDEDENNENEEVQ